MISVIIPVYNMETGNRLRFCLESITGQTIGMDCLDVIGVDDCSTDGSYGILKEYEAAYPGHFRAVKHDRNTRQGGARNTGLDMARGEYISFIDSDDWIDPGFYERMLSLAESSGADMVGCDYRYTESQSFEGGSPVAMNLPEQTGELNDLKYKSLILKSGSLVTKIYRREMFEEPLLRFPEGIFYEDNAIAPSLMLRSRHFEYIPEAMYFYYRYGNSTTTGITEERCRDRMEASRIMLSAAEKDGSLYRYREEYEYLFTRNFYINTLFSYVRNVKKPSLSFMEELGQEMARTFPGFRENPYYLENTDPEEQRYIALQQKDTRIFSLKYRALWFYRDLRKKISS
ncbi:MAG: glycosyltransferase [Lachnospiraceae bacterium]|nr:glycosyltransferase [Lachnospiraceae bacterium]